MADWVELGKGLADSFTRWLKRGKPVGSHTELCRKEVARFPLNDEFQINLNKNLYKPNEGKIFSKGTDLEEKEYIHVKIRDMRLEFTQDEFRAISDGFKEAREKLEEISSSSDSLLQKA